MFGQKKARNEHADIIAEIRNGRRRKPKHDHPTSIRGKMEPQKAHPVDEYVFEEFAWFGATLDFHTVEQWSFEETSDTMRRAWYLDSPTFGRRWHVYYNALRLGWIEVSAEPNSFFDSVDTFIADPKANVDAQLELMKFIPAEHVSNLLFQISFLMQSIEDGLEVRKAQARLKAESAMTIYMWEVIRADDRFVPVLDYSTEGSYSAYRETIAHWRQTGFNPFTSKS